MDAGHEVRRLEAADQRGKHRRSDDKVDDAINIHRHQDAGPGGGDHRVAAADQFTHANQRLGAGRDEGNQGYIDSGGEELQRRADVAKRKLELLVSDDELEARRKKWKPAKARPGDERGYRKLFLDTVQQADRGCDFEFLAPPLTSRTPT